MTTLRELQDLVMCQILEGNAPRAWELVEARGIEPVKRLDIYAHNAAENFHNSLRSSFPVIARLGGEDYFRGCTRLYQRRVPSRCGDLQDVGAHFPAFLGELHADDAHRYFEDVARLEWQYQHALVAADHPSLDLSELAAVNPDRHDELRFSLHPAVRLYASAFPAVTIWEANTTGHDAPPIIGLDAGSERLAFTRSQGRVEWLRLTAGEYRFLADLEQGAAFGDAVGTSVALDPEFDSVAALQGFVLSAVIVDFRLDPPSGLTARAAASHAGAAASAVSLKD